MKTLARIVGVALAALALPGAARADGWCGDDELAPVEAWLSAHPFAAAGSTLEHRVVSSCAALPGHPDTTIVAAIYQGPTDDRKNMVVALLDVDAGNVHNVYKGVIDEDRFFSIGADSLRVDTADYRLARGVRAFGIDLQPGYSKPPCASGQVRWRRSLFVPDHDTLRPVLDALAISSFSTTPNTDRCGDVQEIEDTTTTTTIAIGAHATNGFADLLLTDTIKTGSHAQRRGHATLRYDGAQYQSTDPKESGRTGESSIEPESTPTPEELMRAPAPASAPARPPTSDAQPCSTADLAVIDQWLAKHPWREGTTWPDLLAASACAPAPADAKLRVVVAAYARGRDAEDCNEIVALVDPRRRVVRAVFTQDILEDVNTRVGGFTIAATRYELAAGVQGIGVDFHSSAHARAYDYHQEGDFTLFVQQGRALRPVLTGFASSTWTSVPDTQGRGELSNWTLAVGSGRSHGLADLVATRTTQPDDDATPTLTERSVLRYDGKQYGDANRGSQQPLAPAAH